jgi:membrane protein implicated in regulation of membrane protease activity
MGTWIIWLIVAAILGVAEVMTATLAFGLVAAAALVGAGVGAAGGNAALQFGAFAIASAAGLGIARPFAMRHIRQPPLLRTGTAALVGRSATRRGGALLIFGIEVDCRDRVGARAAGRGREVARIKLRTLM